MFEITHGERIGWQRRAAMRLTEILAAHRDLPVLAWTVADAGSVLVGRVSGLGPAGEVQSVFDAWCAALDIGEQAERPSSGGSICLWATTNIGRVKVTLIATFFPGEGED